MTIPGADQRVHVLFATVTGNAQEIARRIHSDLQAKSFPAGILCAVEDYAKTGLGTPEGSSNAFIFVAATTGDGDAPETSRAFMRFLRKKEPALLKDVPYTVLGLGDTNYENFCKNGKKIDTALKKLGAVSFYKRGDADDGTGLEDVVEPWIDGLWSALGDIVKTALPVAGENLKVGAQTTDEKMEGIIKEAALETLGLDEADLPRLLAPTVKTQVLSGGSTDPALSVSSFYSGATAKVASVSGARRLTAEGAEKTVWHIELAAEEDAGFEGYRAGDAFGMLVENDAAEVSELFTYLAEDEGDTVLLQNLDGTTIATGTARQLVAERVDIRALSKKTLLRALSAHCSTESEKRLLLHLSSKPGREQYASDILGAGLSFLALLRTLAPSCRPPIALLLDQLPPLPPRWYSATSSPGLDGPGSLHFAFSVVPSGLATPTLAARCEAFLAGEKPAPVVLVPRASDAESSFRPPANLETSYVMVGPGTGVAPFRGFLRERAAQLASSTSAAIGETVLFFGCRREEEDFLYQEEMEGLRDRGVLSTLDVAFSRAGPEKVYVQHRMKQLSEMVARIVKGGGSLFVCGDGGGMAKGVDDALRDVLAERLFEGDVKRAKAEMKKMAEEHRYVRDVWYFG